jgi:hypothetical protein
MSHHSDVVSVLAPGCREVVELLDAVARKADASLRRELTSRTRL